MTILKPPIDMGSKIFIKNAYSQEVVSVQLLTLTMRLDEK